MIRFLTRVMFVFTLVLPLFSCSSDKDGTSVITASKLDADSNKTQLFSNTYHHSRSESQNQCRSSLAEACKIAGANSYVSIECEWRSRGDENGKQRKSRFPSTIICE